MQSVVLSKYLTHYGPRTYFPYYNHTTVHREGSTYPPLPPQGHTAKVCVFETWQPSPVLKYVIKKWLVKNFIWDSDVADS